MFLSFAIIATILLGCSIICYIEVSSFSAAICLILSIIFIIISGAMYSLKQEHSKPKIDLPEEYKLISNQPSKPDTLTAYWKNDTLFIQFK